MMQVFSMGQGSEAWRIARLGIPTASRFKDILAGGGGKTRRAYLHELAAEIITGRPAEGPSSPHMERGKAWEEEARDAYAFLTATQPELIGFVTNHGAGASPDALVGLDGMLEIKTKAAHLMIAELLREDAPPEFKAQTQGQLWICEREWNDLVIYSQGFEPRIHRLTRDEPYIRALSEAVEAFRDDLAEVVERIRQRGRAA